MLLNIIFRCSEILVYFLSCDPEKKKRLDRILFKPRHIIFMMYITMSKTFIKIDSPQQLEISRET